ncbi:prepilin peptidase [Anaeromyxobacter paludicola]|uniref:Prepilin leader peptidase/N-methyltransferase n=1 Tax=Anaeromyxobacter paludicola TaxID=2918171 RepID=A0ABN6N9J3_9BACT|nr:A24 family peptidase [Anaeromyxobacter paludicola]BDG09031.1 hypothetical protein AMPC_21440 [Anaeromyxobacter paludicola]
MPIEEGQIAELLAALWVVALGAVVGSFLNVVIARVPAGESIVRPRSRCPRCGAGIAWYDNVPVLSWLLLRARCRRCRAPISIRYPVVEALGAGLAWLAFYRHGLSAEAAAEFAYAAVLLSLAFIDLDTWLLPNALTWPLILLGLAAAGLGLSAAPSFRSAAMGAAAGFVAFGAVSVIGEKVFHKEAMGFGDVWLLAGLGAWHGLAALLPVVLLASLQGSVVGLALIALGKGQPGPKPREAAGGEGALAAPPQPSPPGGEGELHGPPAGDAVAASPPGCEREAPLTSEAPLPGGDEPLFPPPAERGRVGDGAEPDAEPDAVDPDADWVPPKNAVPFGPFLVLAAFEWLYLSQPLSRLVPALGLFR